MEPKLVIVHGTSGATIHVADFEAIKYSPKMHHWDRLKEQSMYMAEHGYPFADIHGIAEGRYWLQRLQPLNGFYPDWAPYDKETLPHTLQGAKKSLSLLWGREYSPRLNFSWDSHCGYVTGICDAQGISNEVKTVLVQAMSKVEDDYMNCRIRVCWIHGDATLDNVMLDDQGRMRWIDPIPASKRMPPLMAQDLGKLLQSAAGYERVKYGTDEIVPQYEEAEAVLAEFPEEEQFAACYFFALACLRMLPYTNGRVHAWARGILECYSSSILTEL